MIDLVFVLTNKLDVSVKEIRKTVFDNQQDNIVKFEELANVQNKNWELRDQELEHFNTKLDDLQNHIKAIYGDQEVMKTEITNLKGRILFF